MLAKASRIIAVDTNPEKFEIAKKWYESLERLGASWDPPER